MMKKFLLAIPVLCVLLPLCASAQESAGQAYLKQLTPRDSILIADQVRYGFILEGVEPGTALAFPDLSQGSNDTLVVVRSWQLDTLLKGKVVTGRKAEGVRDIDASIVIAPFEEGTYYLPPLAVCRKAPGGEADTLFFDPQVMEVKTMPVDTATFQIHDIKDQILYPVTFKEVLPYILGTLVFAALIVLLVRFIRSRRRDSASSAVKEPAYIIALRKLDHYRGDKYWAPEKQKTFYSGITDALRFYIADRFSIDAMEMTTAEIFDALKSDNDLSPELYSEAKDLFELADFVKFAKHIVSDEENARALPAAVRFVTSTYQADVESEIEEAKEQKE